MLAETRGRIELTGFGRQVADGKITKSEFASVVVRTLRLPNPNIMSAGKVALWESAGLVIKPLDGSLLVQNPEVL